MNDITRMMTALILLLSALVGFAQMRQSQQQQAKKDYALSAVTTKSPEYKTLKFDPEQINVVAALVNQKCLSCSFDGFITKSFKISVILEVLDLCSESASRSVLQ